MLNKICEDCMRLNNGCSGTKCQVYTGCTRYERDSAKALQHKKFCALEEYKKAKEKYLENQSKENWLCFCDCKRVCMLLGVQI